MKVYFVGRFADAAGAGSQEVAVARIGGKHLDGRGECIEPIEADHDAEENCVMEEPWRARC